MKLSLRGAIDCDMHPAPPPVSALLPYLGEYWRDQFVNRHIDRLPFQLTSYPPASPLSGRPDWRTPEGVPGGGLDLIRSRLLDPFQLQFAVCNTLHGAVGLFNEDMAVALCSAVNDWTAKELLDRESRLRGSILLAVHNPEAAAAEIERLASDRRFVQAHLLVMGDMMLGRRLYWPIYAAAERHGITLGVHAGSTYRWAPTPTGWPSYKVEDYVAQSAAFETQLVSFLAEGVFQKFPRLKIVLSESGFTWLPGLLWRTNKSWRGVRPEVPWIDRPPADIIRDQVRFTLQPIDAPRGGNEIERIVEHIGSDRVLLFSSDYPHWHFDGEDCLPDGLSAGTVQKLVIDNPLETYPRLREGVVSGDSSERNREPVP